MSSLQFRVDVKGGIWITVLQDAITLARTLRISVVFDFNGDEIVVPDDYAGHLSVEEAAKRFSKQYMDDRFERGRIERAGKEAEEAERKKINQEKYGR